MMKVRVPDCIFARSIDVFLELFFGRNADIAIYRTDGEIVMKGRIADLRSKAIAMAAALSDHRLDRSLSISFRKRPQCRCPRVS